MLKLIIRSENLKILIILGWNILKSKINNIIIEFLFELVK